MIWLHFYRNGEVPIWPSVLALVVATAWAGYAMWRFINGRKKKKSSRK